MNYFAKGNGIKMRKARLWFLLEMGIVAAVIYIFKIPTFWACFLTLVVAVDFAWDRYCDIWDERLEVASDIRKMRQLWEAAVDSFVSVRMDDEHGLNFVLDMLAARLHPDLGKR
jgi:hypothetical protein